MKSSTITRGMKKTSVLSEKSEIKTMTREHSFS